MNIRNNLICVVVLFGFTVSFGQMTGQLGGAGTISKNTSQGLVNVGIYDQAIGLLGHYRYGIGGYTDATGKIGFLDFSDGNESGMILGGDVRYQVMEVRINDPIDLSVGGLFETMVFLPHNSFTMGAFVSGSHPLRLNSGKHLSPYGRLSFGMTWVNSKGDFDLGFNAGTSLEINNNTSVAAEFKFHDPFGFFIGMNFGL